MPKARTSPKQLFRNVDWEHVSNALLLYGQYLCNGDRVIQGLGIGAEDLVDETICDLWNLDGRIRWNSKRFGPATTNSVIRLLKRVLRNRHLDYHKRAAHRREEPENRFVDGDQGRQATHLDRRADILSRAQRSIKAARECGDIEVELYLTLQLDHYRNRSELLTNAEAASEMGTQPSDIVNLKKRIKRLDAKTPELRIRE